MEPQPKLNEIVFDEDRLADFLKNTPLSACDEDQRVLAAVLPCDPHAFCKPIAGKEAGHVLVVGMVGFQTFFRLPSSVTYKGLRVTTTIPVAGFEIDTATGTVTTNMQELRSLSRSETEAEREAAFATLAGRFEAAKPRPKPRVFSSIVLGRVRPDDYGDTWFAAPLSIPYFDGRALPVLLQDIGPSDAKRIDAALANFLALTREDRLAASPAVLANCKEFLEAIGPDDEADKAMYGISDPAEIWQHVSNEELQVVKDDSDGEPAIYIALACACDWEREHGLQLVYRDGRTLTRVSAQDGHVT